MFTQQSRASWLRRTADLLPVIGAAILLATYISFYSGYLRCSGEGAACSPVSSQAVLAAVKSADEPRVAIYVARGSWTLASGLYLLACLAALFTACFVMYEALLNIGKTSLTWLIIIMVLVAIDVALAISFWASGDTLSPAQQLLRATVGQVLPSINKCNRLFDTLSLTATLSLACAACATLWQRGPKKPATRRVPAQPDDKAAVLAEQEDLRRRQELLRYVLYVGGALLAIAVLRFSLTLSWGASFLPPDSEMGRSVNSLVTGIVNSMGTFYAVLMGAVYIPAALVLQSRAKRLAVRAAPDDPNGWLTKNGFSLSISEYLPRLIALLGPMLAGPLGELLVRATSAVSG